MHIRTLAAVLLSTLLPLGAQVGAAAAPPVNPGPVHVDGTVLVGSAGQEVFLRGVNVNALVAYNPRHPEAVPVTAASFQEMAALGLNFVRLPLSLSLLEPKPGQISTAYLDNVRSVVDMAGQAGLYVLLDLHQDHYAANLYDGESDGMPAWMVDTLGLPTHPTLFGVTNPAVQGAFTAFWQNRVVDGIHLWSAYDLALSALARAVQGNPYVVGIDVMNEPNPGFDLSPDFPRQFLLPFYRQAVAAIRRVTKTLPIFLEPDIVSAALGHLTWPAEPFLRDGIVFAPHEYLPSGLFPAAHGSALTKAADGALTLLYERAAAAARAMHLPWVVGEFGAGPTTLGDREIEAEVELQDALGVGAAFWLWQIRPGSYDWQLVEPDGSLTPDTARLAALVSPHPEVLGGRLVGMGWDRASGAFHLVYRAEASEGPTVVVTSSLAYPTGIAWQASVHGLMEAQPVAIPGRTLTLYRITLPPAEGLVSLSITPRPARSPQAP